MRYLPILRIEIEIWNGVSGEVENLVIVCIPISFLRGEGLSTLTYSWLDIEERKQNSIANHPR